MTRRSWSSRHGWRPTGAGSSSSPRSLTARPPRRYANQVLRGHPLDDPDALWVHELIGRRVVEVDGTEHGTCVSVHREPGGRPARARLGRARSVELRRVERRRCDRGRHPRGSLRPRRDHDRAADRRLLAVPLARRRLLRREPAGQGPRHRPARSAMPRHPRADDRRASHGRRCAVRWWRRHGDAGRSRSSRPSKPSSRPGRCSCSARAGVGSIRRWPTSWRRPTASACCAGATRASTIGFVSISSTARSASATSCSAGERLLRAWSSRP